MIIIHYIKKNFFPHLLKYKSYNLFFIIFYLLFIIYFTYFTYPIFINYHITTHIYLLS